MLEIGTHRGCTSWGDLGVPIPERQLLQTLSRRATTMVSNARGPQRNIHARGRQKRLLLCFDRSGICISTDRRQHQGLQFRSASAAPAKQAMAERHLSIPGQFVGTKPAHAFSGSHCWEACTKPKTVGQPSQLMAPLGERTAAVALAESELLPKRGRAHQHTVGFDPGAIDGLPPPGSTGGLNALPQCGPEALYPGVKRRRGMGKAQLRKALHECERRAKGAFCRLPRVGHRPEPSQIEVGMTNPMHCTSCSFVLLQKGRDLLRRVTRIRSNRQPLLRQGLKRWQRQIKGLGQKQLLRIRIDGRGFSHHLARDQRAIVMARAA